MAAVCSDKCKEEIEKKVTDGTWMIMRSFPKTEKKMMVCQRHLQINSLEQHENTIANTILGIRSLFDFHRNDGWKRIDGSDSHWVCFRNV
jgi:hypothetical protein